MPLRFGTQPEGDCGIVVRIAHGLGQQSVFARHFVERGDEKRLVEEFDAGGRRSFDAGDHVIKGVKGWLLIDLLEHEMAVSTFFGHRRAPGYSYDILVHRFTLEIGDDDPIPMHYGHFIIIEKDYLP